MCEEHIAGVFSRAASTFDRFGPRFFSHYGRRLAEVAHIPSGVDVLDVATGRGAILLPAAKQVGPQGRVIGIDLSTGMLHEIAAEARRSGLKNVEIQQMDAERLAFSDASFDCALCGHSIVFFPRAVGEFYRVLRPGGQVGMTTISRGCFDWLFDALRSHTPPEEAQTNDEDEEQNGPALDTPKGMEETLSQAGFGNIRVMEEETDLVYTEEEWWSTMWTLGIRGTLEQMEPATLESLKADIFQRLQAFKQPDGVHILFRVLFASGTRS